MRVERKVWLPWRRYQPNPPVPEKIQSSQLGSTIAGRLYSRTKCGISFKNTKFYEKVDCFINKTNSFLGKE